MILSEFSLIPRLRRSWSSVSLAALLMWAATAGCPAGEAPSGSKDPPPPPPPESAVFSEAARQFREMKSTFYQWRTQVNREAGSYCYDCVGFVSWTLKEAAPAAWASTVTATGIAKGRIPSPPRYQVFFASLAASPQPGWEAVTKVSQLLPGDVVAWEQRTKTAVGHAVIIAGRPAPLAEAEGSWQVEVFDSTGSPHTGDSRPTDERAQILPSNGRRSGLGKGTMVFIADPVSGALTGLKWSLKGQAVTVPIAAGRPIPGYRDVKIR